MNRQIAIRFGIFLFFFYLISYIISRYFGFSVSEIQDFVMSFGFLAPFVYSLFLFLGLSVPLNPISDFLIINIGVIAFPFYIAILFTFIGHSISIIVNYFVGLKYGKRILDRIVTKENSKYIEKYTNQLTIKKLFVIRFIVPVATVLGADVVSYVAGMQRLPFLKYYLASIVPWTLLSIIYFTFSAYLINRSILLYFLPAIFVVGTPMLIIYLNRDKLKLN